MAVNPERAFAHFTINHELESWLATIAEVESREGGKYELFWNPQNRESDSTLGCQVTAFVENQLLAFDWKSPTQFNPFANFADPLTHVTVSFIPVPGGTNVHLVHSGWRNSREWRAAKDWQERAWRGAVGILIEKIN